MNLQDKEIFVDDILTSLKNSIEKKIKDMPEEWDGFEIRQFIADYFNCHYVTSTMLSGTRKRNYKNTLLITTLL